MIILIKQYCTTFRKLKNGTDVDKWICLLADTSNDSADNRLSSMTDSLNRSRKERTDSESPDK